MSFTGRRLVLSGLLQRETNRKQPFPGSVLFTLFGVGVKANHHLETEKEFSGAISELDGSDRKQWRFPVSTVVVCTHVANELVPSILKWVPRTRVWVFGTRNQVLEPDRVTRVACLSNGSVHFNLALPFSCGQGTTSCLQLCGQGQRYTCFFALQLEKKKHPQRTKEMPH